MEKNTISKIAAAIEFIEAHLNEKIDLARIAGAVHYSKYHFHKVFTEVVGLTVHEYVQRRQLTEGAKLLVFSNKPIVDIATMSGYESQQAFTNVFTAMYKQSPNKYREGEKFYPLQLEFRLAVDQMELSSGAIDKAMIRFATDADVNCWLELVRLVIDGFPHWDEAEYRLELRRRIQSKQAFILKDGAIAIGIMMFNRASGSIDFMGTHPLYRKRGIPQVFIDKVLTELAQCSTISTTSYRAGDRADTGQRRAWQELGFAEAELMVELGFMDFTKYDKIVIK